jgi:hypothetical protein
MPLNGDALLLYCRGCRSLGGGKPRFPTNSFLDLFDKDWSLLEIDPDLCMLLDDLPGLVSFLQTSDREDY